MKTALKVDEKADSPQIQIPGERDMLSQDITADIAVQSRETMDKEAIEEYAEAMQHGAKFPPVVVFHDGEKYWLADGFHRHQAALQAECRLGVAVKFGTRRDAVLHAAGANSIHGLRRTNADKRNAARKLLQDQEWCEWNDREIAKHCGVSDRFVGSLRKELSPNGSEITQRKVTRKGTTYCQDTSHIGKRREARADTPDDPHRLEFHPERERSDETDFFGNEKTRLHVIVNEACDAYRRLRDALTEESTTMPKENLQAARSVICEAHQTTINTLDKVLKQGARPRLYASSASAGPSRALLVHSA